MIELERHIEILLLSNDCVIVPGFGGFMAHHVDARYDGKDSLFLPPLRTIGFNPQLQLNDSLLAQSYVEAYDISYPEAIERLESEVDEIRQHLDSTGKYEFNNIGTLYLNEDGNYSFEPCEAGILTPEFYGLGSVDILPLCAIQAPATTELGNKNAIITEIANNTEEATGIKPGSATTVFDADEEEGKAKAEFIKIKKSLIRNIVAACIAIIVFFALSSPLKTPNVQMSKVDTSVLTRIIPKEMTKEAPAEDVANKAKSNVLKLEAFPSEEKQLTEQEEMSQAKPYYSIVLASRVTKRNAASYAERLQAQGLKDTKVIITTNNVKVVYGTFDSEEQARKTLSDLRHNEVFSDGWITKINE